MWSEGKLIKDLRTNNLCMLLDGATFRWTLLPVPPLLYNANFLTQNLPHYRVIRKWQHRLWRIVIIRHSQSTEKTTIMRSGLSGPYPPMEVVANTAIPETLPFRYIYLYLYVYLCSSFSAQHTELNWRKEKQENQVFGRVEENNCTSLARCLCYRSPYNLMV